MIDLVNLKDFSMDKEKWHATLGSGFRLGDLDDHLHDNGGRAMAHGTCPGVGIGGHATIVSPPREPRSKEPELTRHRVA